MKCGFCEDEFDPSRRCDGRSTHGAIRRFCGHACRIAGHIRDTNFMLSFRYWTLVSLGATPKEARAWRSKNVVYEAKLKELQAARATPFSQDMNANTAPTLVPAAYPELEAEVYASLDPLLDRSTMMPSAPEAEELVAESRR